MLKYIIVMRLEWLFQRKSKSHELTLRDILKTIY